MKFTQLFKLIALLLMFSTSITAQDEDTESLNNGWPLRVAYYGDNGQNLGIRAGTSYVLHQKVKVKTRKSKRGIAKKGASKTKLIQYKVDANLGFYNQPNNHSGLIIGTGITRYKNKNEKRLSTAWSFEINYLSRFYNIDTYEIDEDGSINELALSGNGGLVFALAPSFERKFGKKEWIIFLKPIAQAVKYNHAFYANYAIEFGTYLNLFK